MRHGKEPGFQTASSMPLPSPGERTCPPNAGLPDPHPGYQESRDTRGLLLPPSQFRFSCGVHTHFYFYMRNKDPLKRGGEDAALSQSLQPKEGEL